LLQPEVVDRETVYSYQWLERLPEGWRAPTTGKDVFATQALPPGIELELELEGAPVTDLGQAVAEEELTPQVVFYSSGETTAGTIEVRRRADGELLWRIEWDLLGRFRLLPRGEDPELE
jgi:hypothetical protein